MPYTALPDMRIPYDNDGTVVGYGNLFDALTTYPSGATLIGMQGIDFETVRISAQGSSSTKTAALWFFFPEQREVTGFAGGWFGDYTGRYDTGAYASQAWSGSNDTTNGMDGSWETASLPSGYWPLTNDYQWRATIRPISFTGAKKVVRHTFLPAGQVTASICGVHVYGEKAAGQTPDDIIFINHDDTPGVEFTAPEDFGDQPLATTVVRQFRIKNTSSTKTANTINIQCNDSDFAISENGSTWVTTINITSLSAGAESATLYVRCTTPAVGSILGPRHARIVVTVASYT